MNFNSVLIDVNDETSKAVGSAVSTGSGSHERR